MKYNCIFLFRYIYIGLNISNNTGSYMIIRKAMEFLSAHRLWCKKMTINIGRNCNRFLMKPSGELWSFYLRPYLEQALQVRSCGCASMSSICTVKLKRDTMVLEPGPETVVWVRSPTSLPLWLK